MPGCHRLQDDIDNFILLLHHLPGRSTGADRITTAIDELDSDTLSRVWTDMMSTCSLNQWVRSLVGLITSAGTGKYFPPLQFTCRNCGGGDRGRVAIYRPFGEFRRAKSYCHLYGAQGQRQAYLLPMPR
ncbi:hypothetical protein TNCV_4837391 [Trichonephila clavipes]|nr:hypothetical protein TNCV_4837391 [Trichonephila clavipes]